MEGRGRRHGSPTAHAVVFDLDDTLVVEQSQARNSLCRLGRFLNEDHEVDHGADDFAVIVLETAVDLWRAGPHLELCRDLGIASWEGLWSTFDGNHPTLDGLREWAPRYRGAVWRTALARVGVDDPTVATTLDAAYVDSQRAGHPLFAGADAVVHGLAGTCRLGLLTNGPADIQRHKFAGTGLAASFDAVVVSGEVGVGKPAAAVFHDVLDRLETTAADAVMVGDSWSRDVVGALGVGMTAVWVSGGREPTASHPGVCVIATVADLPDVLGADITA